MPVLDPLLADQIFCSTARRHKLDKILLKAIAVIESAMDPRAYRFEPLYYENYMKNDPQWAGRDPMEISASYGLMQVLYPTAVRLGWTGEAEDLYDPVINVELGAALVRELQDHIVPKSHFKVWPIDICLARYNGGYSKNPGLDGLVRNSAYVEKVKQAYWFLRMKGETEEGGCKDEV
jgi:soluble lytic murein transglycosylase-like protein